MLHTKIDPLWGRPCQAIQLQAVPPTACLNGLIRLQDELEERLGLALRRIPAQCLHCTILTVLPPAREFPVSKFEIWETHARDWTGMIADATGSTDAFHFRFDQIVASEMAIFVQAPVPPSLTQLRKMLAAGIVYDGWHPRPPDIAHITLFRYAESAPLPELAATAAGLPLTMPVEHLRLIKETGYPTLNSEDLGLFGLRPAPGDKGVS
jgi:hypothetical protein